VSIRTPRALVAAAIAGSLALVACSSGGGAATQAGGGASQAAGGTTSGAPSQAAAPAAGGGETVKVVLTGGPDAGTYTTNADPLCSHNIIGKNGWGVQYSTADKTGDKDFTSLQLVNWAGDPDPEGMFSDTKFLMTVGIGPLVAGRTYDIAVTTSGSESKGSGSATIQEGNPTVITATGTTAEGVKVEAHVTCPKITGA
jgi:hypothetical protein